MIDNSFEIGDKVTIKADVIGVHSELKFTETGEQKKVSYYDIAFEKDKTFVLHYVREDLLELVDNARD